MKTHLIYSRYGGADRIIMTACGREAYATSISDEFVTADGGCIEATDNKRRVTCKRCSDAKPKPPLSRGSLWGERPRSDDGSSQWREKW